jgi:hypothetical protein
LAVSKEPEDIMRDFRRLQVRQQAHRFVHDLYRDTQGFPAQQPAANG